MDTAKKILSQTEDEEDDLGSDDEDDETEDDLEADDELGDDEAIEGGEDH